MRSSFDRPPVPNRLDIFPNEILIVSVVPPPRPPADLGALSDAELQQMEGQERRHLEARIHVLSDIQTLLYAAVLQMNQYGLLVACDSMFETNDALPHVIL